MVTRELHGVYRPLDSWREGSSIEVSLEPYIGLIPRHFTRTV